jgi:hypothetical protein
LGAKNAFGFGSTLLKIFHAGDKQYSSTPKLIAWAKDIEANWTANATMLTTKGKLIADDLTELTAARSVML